MFYKRVNYTADVGGREEEFRFTVDKQFNGDYNVKFFGAYKIWEGNDLAERKYNTLLEFLVDLVEADLNLWLPTEPKDMVDVIGQLLVGDGSLEIDIGDKKAIMERWAKPGRFEIHEAGYVSENIEISVGPIKEEDGYLVGSVLVDGGRYPFDYCLETEELEIHHYSKPSWLDGSCYEKNLPSVVQRNYEDVSGEIRWKVEEYLQVKAQKGVDDIIAGAASRVDEGKVCESELSLGR